MKTFELGFITGWNLAATIYAIVLLSPTSLKMLYGTLIATAIYLIITKLKRNESKAQRNDQD